MKAYKSILSFCLFLVAVRHGNSYTALNEKSVCTNGMLIQYTNFFHCVCDKGKVHEAEDKCADIVEKCTEANQVCGEYAKCALEVDRSTIACKCQEGYEKEITTKDDEEKLVCIPKGCSGFKGKCEGGFCIKKSDTEAQCGCRIGTSPSTDKKCVEATTPAECKLTCPGDKAKCVLSADKNYECGCEEKYQLTDGKCVLKKKGAGFPGSGFLNVGLLVLLSSIVYILV